MIDNSTILNIDASTEEIKNFYRRESLKYYKTNNVDKVNKLNTLYKTILSNKNNISDKDNISNNNITTTTSSSNIEKNLDIFKKVNISINQSYNGTSIPIEINRTVKINNIIRTEIETIYVNIYRGIDNNEIITVLNKGDRIDNVSGNVLICIQLNNNSQFIRKGIDLILNKSISFKDALCGFTFTYTHINNQKYNIINYNNVIYHNYEKIIEKLGMVRDNLAGNLIIKFQIQYPVSLTAKQISVIKEHF